MFHKGRLEFVHDFVAWGPGVEFPYRTGAWYWMKLCKKAGRLKGKAWLGVGFATQESSGLLGRISNFLFSFKKPNVYYKPKFEAGLFIYNLLWWIVLISFSVALINMLPVGIFDGGRFFYLTILAITKSERKAKRTFSFVTYFFLFLILLLMVFWLFSFW